MKYAFIQNNVAVEVVQADPFMLFVQPYAEQFQEVDDTCQNGSILQDGNWIQPPVIVAVPQEVTMRQARLALLENGLLANVQPAINSLPEPDKTKAQIEWDYSNGLERGNAFVATLGAALGLNAAGIDALFLQASLL